MAGTKISDLPSAGALTGAELVPVVQSDVTRKTTIDDIKTAVAAGTVTSVDVSGGSTGLTATGGPITTSGTITLGGTLDVDNGGTGATTAANARTNLDVPSRAGSGASGTWSIDISGNAGTVTNGVYITGSYSNPSWITALAGSKITGDISGNAGNVTGTVAVANGGTGANTLTGYVKGSGTSALTASSTIPGSDISGNISGNAANVTGTVAVANGGTGATTATGARTNLGLVIGTDIPSPTGTGASGTWSISVNGNAATVTNGVVTTGSYADPTWITSLAGSKITGNISGNAANVTGTVAVANGGTGQTSYTNGQLLIGNTTGNTLNKATLTAGSGITITNGAGSITIAASGAGSGTVTSVDVSGGSTGLTTSGGPVTGSGTITLAGTLAVGYGGTGATTAANARVNLLPSYTGNNGKVLALNSGGTDVQWISAGGTGTVTSVDVSGGTTGLSFTGGPITASGTITAGGTLAVANGGTGATTASTARSNLSAAASGANSDITSLSGITGGISTADYVDFDTVNTPATAVGRIFWDGGTTLSVGMTANVTGHVNETLFIYVKASAAIAKGDVIVQDGTVGASGVLKAKPAPTNTTNAQTILGVAAEAIALNGFGLIQTHGYLTGLNTTGSSVSETWADGEQLYYNPSYAGGLTNVKPSAPNLKLPIAEVVNAGSGTSGSLIINMGASSVLGGTDSNVQFGTLSNNDVIVYDSTAQYWKNVAQSTLAAGSVANALTINNSGTGDASGSTFNGSAAKTISYNSIGASPLAGSSSLTTVGTIGSGTWNGSTIGVAYGGTGLTSGTSGGVLYYSASGTLASSSALAANALVVGGGAGVAPSTVTTGTGVVTALGVNTGSAGAFVVNGGALGTPSSGTVTNLTGTASININGTVGATTPTTGAFTTLSASSTATLSGLTASTALALDASKNIVSVTNTGSGNNVLATSPTLTTPILGTPTSGNLSNCTADGTNSVGYRNIPQSGSDKTTSYTLATTDVGKFIGVGSSGSITVPNSTFAAGDVVSIFNNTTGNVTLTMSITTAYIAGTNTDKDTLTLATRGVATILFISGTVCVVSGNVT